MGKNGQKWAKKMGFGAVGPKVAEGHQPSAGAGKVAPVRARPFLVINIGPIRQANCHLWRFIMIMKIMIMSMKIIGRHSML